MQLESIATYYVSCVYYNRGLSEEMIGMKKKTEEEFVTESKNIHDDFYTYDKVEYINTRTKVIITCPEHGDFKQTPSSHLSGSGCSECRKSKLSNRFRLKKEDVIENIKTANSNIGIKEFDYLNCKVKIPVFDLEYDIQLQKAVELFDNNKIIYNNENFILKEGK